MEITIKWKSKKKQEALELKSVVTEKKNLPEYDRRCIDEG